MGLVSLSLVHPMVQVMCFLVHVFPLVQGQDTFLVLFASLVLVLVVAVGLAAQLAKQLHLLPTQASPALLSQPLGSPFLMCNLGGYIRKV